MVGTMHLSGNVFRSGPGGPQVIGFDDPYLSDALVETNFVLVIVAGVVKKINYSFRICWVEEIDDRSGVACLQTVVVDQGF